MAFSISLTMINFLIFLSCLKFVLLFTYKSEIIKMRYLKYLAAVLYFSFLTSCYEDTTLIDANTNNNLEKYPAELLSVEPAEAFVGDTIIINGDKFTADSRIINFIRIDTIESNVTIKYSNNRIEMRVPENVSFGKVKITVSVDDTLSNEIEFTVLRPVFIPLDLADVPAGTFSMGDNSGEGFSNELPVHEVTLTRDLLVSKYELSQQQWKSLVSSNPSLTKNDELPVHNISWKDAVLYANLLSEKEGLTKCYTINDDEVVFDYNANGYRLPTEAEWEYICRAGTQTKYYNGDSKDNLHDIAWYYDQDSINIHKSGLKQPNAFGIYDIVGNVSEYCWDIWSNSYTEDAQTDPTGAASGPGRVLRGAAWVSNSNACRSSFRYYYYPDEWRVWFAGMRLVRNK